MVVCVRVISLRVYRSVTISCFFLISMCEHEALHLKVVGWGEVKQKKNAQ